MIIITRSGTRYLFRQNRVTRMSEIPILHAEDTVLINEPVTWADVPVIGRPWHYDTAQGPFRTTSVVGFDFEAIDLDATPL